MSSYFLTNFHGKRKMLITLLLKLDKYTFVRLKHLFFRNVISIKYHTKEEKMFLPKNQKNIFLKPWFSGTSSFFDFFGLFQMRQFSSFRFSPNHISQSQLRFKSSGLAKLNTLKITKNPSQFKVLQTKTHSCLSFIFSLDLLFGYHFYVFFTF